MLHSPLTQKEDSHLDQAKNFAKGTLTAGIDGDDTSLTVDTGQGLRFPTPPFNAVIWDSTDYPDPADDPGVEVVRVTAISTDTLTITRAQEGTTNSEHNTLGKTYQIIAPLTAKAINDIAPAVSRISDDGDAFRINDVEGVALKLDRANGIATLGDVDDLVEGTKVIVGVEWTTITNILLLPELPTSNPAIAGALWNDSGTVKVSAG